MKTYWYYIPFYSSLQCDLEQPPSEWFKKSEMVEANNINNITEAKKEDLTHIESQL